jgi:GDP/UDP-N,N'-diacetylbacillosamine 2-epimerase (hydrolysing)
MKIAILTSSRADYGIYLPLLSKLKNDKYFEIELIAFGSHLSKSLGYTIDEFKNDNSLRLHSIPTLLSTDDEQSIVTSYGLTVIKFADFWNNNKYDLVFCLGDRFEMSAAVQAGIPFNINFAHIHGGETSYGSIDNIFRHQITLSSNFHFTAAQEFSKKVTELIGSSKNVYTVGSLSLDGIKSFIPVEKSLFYDSFSIPFVNFALVTFHPETVKSELNIYFALQMRLALHRLADDIFIVITMPNGDTLGSVFRKEIELLIKSIPNRIICVENFGKYNYFTAMSYASVLIGNSSSGILEAASFGRYVVNVGDRQKGRLQSGNVLNCEFEENAIVKCVKKCLTYGDFTGENVYYKENVAESIVEKIKAL